MNFDENESKLMLEGDYHNICPKSQGRRLIMVIIGILTTGLSGHKII